MLFRFRIELFFTQHGEDLHLLHDLANVLHGMNYVTGTSFAFGADHRRAFRNTAQGLAQIAGAANERNREGVLIDVVRFVSRRKNFGLVDVVDAELLQDLRLGEMADAALGHHGDRYSGHDFANLLGGGHAGHAALSANLGGYALERHHGDRSGALGDFGLAGIGDVHNDAALQHFGQAGLQAQAGGVSVTRTIVVGHLRIPLFLNGRLAFLRCVPGFLVLQIFIVKA